MPVSPQDFALWSDLTGNPYPQTPAERMALAPQVHQFTRSIGRSGSPVMSPVRQAVDVVGKAALAAGALAGAAYLGSKYLGGEGGSFGKLELDDEPEVLTTSPSVGINQLSSVVQASGDITPPTTSDRFGQDVIANQTAVVQAAKGQSPVKPTTSPIEAKPATQSEVIGSQQHFSPGSEEEMLGQGAAEKAAAFRRSKAYSVMQKQYPSLGAEEEGLVGGPETAAVSEPVRFTGVQPSPQMRVAKVTETVEESPIASMAETTATAPTTASVQASSGPTMKEIQELDQQLAITHGARMGVTQRQAMRDQILADKYVQSAATPVIAPTRQQDVIETVSPGPYRVAKEGRITPNQYLSEVSQKLGALTAYPVSPETSKDVTNVTFYPGGEVGVTMPTKKYGEKEYAFATSDPYRLALSDYAEEGFPAGMGSVAGTAAPRGVAHQLGLQKTVTPGGTIAASQPEYSGLMDDPQIAKKLRSRSENVRGQAQYHSDTKAVMQALQERAAIRGAGIA